MALTGCQNKVDKAKEEAAKAQNVADDKLVSASKAQNEADAKSEALKMTAEAKLAQDHLEMTKLWKTRYDETALKLGVLEGQTIKVAGANKPAIDTALAEARARNLAVLADFETLKTATPAQWDAAKTQIELDTVAFGASLDALQALVKTTKAGT